MDSQPPISSSLIDSLSLCFVSFADRPRRIAHRGGTAQNLSRSGDAQGIESQAHSPDTGPLGEPQYEPALLYHRYPSGRITTGVQSAHFLSLSISLDFSFSAIGPIGGIIQSLSILIPIEIPPHFRCRVPL